MGLSEKIAANEKVISIWLRAIKDVGFPIVLSSVLIYIGYQWGDRIISAQDNFIQKAANSQDKIINITEKIQLGQTDAVKNQEKILETQDKIIETQKDLVNGKDKQNDVLIQQNKLIEEFIRKNGRT